MKRPVSERNVCNFIRLCYENMTTRCYVGEEVHRQHLFFVKNK